MKGVAADRFNVLLLGDKLDAGEAEALIQAQEKQAAFFIGDERRARATAVLLREDLDFRASPEVVQQAIDLAAEPI